MMDVIIIGVAAAFRRAGIAVREGFGTIESFEKTPSGVRMVFSKEDTRESAEAAVAVVAVGWVADSAGLNLARAGVETDARGYVRVDSRCGLLRRTSTQRATSPAA